MAFGEFDSFPDPEDGNVHVVCNIQAARCSIALTGVDAHPSSYKTDLYGKARDGQAAVSRVVNPV